MAMLFKRGRDDRQPHPEKKKKEKKEKLRRLIFIMLVAEK